MLDLRSAAKAVVPFVGTIVAVLVQWLATGEFDHAELATALTGAFAALVTYLVPNAEDETGDTELPEAADLPAHDPASVPPDEGDAGSKGPA